MSLALASCYLKFRLPVVGVGVVIVCFGMGERRRVGRRGQGEGECERGIQTGWN